MNKNTWTKNMKPIIIVALIILSAAACTNNHRRTHTERIEDNNKTVKIEDDGNTMSMRVKIENTEEPVDYAESFDVRDMSELQKQKLKNHILDSLYKIK